MSDVIQTGSTRLEYLTSYNQSVGRTLACVRVQIKPHAPILNSLVDCDDDGIAAPLSLAAALRRMADMLENDFEEQRK
jgi:hypothetical protein